MSARRPPFGDFGPDLGTARASGFFAFFNLEPSDGESVVGRSAVFRPASSELGPRVLVRFVLADDRFTAVELRILRSFVDDAEQYPFAADITASFLRAALGNAPGVERPAAEIARHQPRFATARVIARAPERLPSPDAAVSEQALVYAGRRATSRAVLGALTLELANISPEGDRILEVRVTPATEDPDRASAWVKLWRGLRHRLAPAATREGRLIGFLRRLGGDDVLRHRFAHDPRGVLQEVGLDPELVGDVRGLPQEAVPAFLRQPQTSATPPAGSETSRN